MSCAPPGVAPMWRIMRMGEGIAGWTRSLENSKWVCSLAGVGFLSRSLSLSRGSPAKAAKLRRSMPMSTISAVTGLHGSRTGNGVMGDLIGLIQAMLRIALLPDGHEALQRCRWLMDLLRGHSRPLHRTMLAKRAKRAKLARCDDSPFGGTPPPR